MDEETCKICEHMVKVCEKLGNRAICETTIQDFKNNKIPIEEVMSTITKNFDQDKFFKVWDELAEEKK
jgi:hypothetical protein